ncbi:MAG: alkaline phosphatase family protein [Alphaproteobacteria bacterium]
MKRFLTGVAAAAAFATGAMAGPAFAAEPAPKLIVAISVDQFGANLFDQYRGKFTGGLKRLMGGVVYPSGYQTHAGTETCPGHSTLLTGKHPNKTGIVGNTLVNLRDPATGQPSYCLLDNDVTLALVEDSTPAPPNVSPKNLMASTLGEWMKAASPQSRVVAVSVKDRAAINMAGHNPDGVFWIAAGKGFTTYVKPGEDAQKKLAPVAAINAQIAATWTTLPKWNYVHADCRALASKWTLGYDDFNSVLPPTQWGVVDDPDAIKKDVIYSPIGDDITLIGARGLIKYYKLGQGAATDLLAVSFSSTDYVGHRFGTQGPEMCEQMYRLDYSLGVLLTDLDALKVPYVVVLSADHGGSDFTERLAARGYDAERMETGAITARVNASLRKQLNLDSDPLDARSLEDTVIVPKFAARKAEIAAAAAKLIAAEPGVAGAFTQEELLATPVPDGKPADEWTLQERYAASTFKGRSADVSVALKPGATSAQPNVRAYIAGHGSPWDYDRRVPILFWWKGAAPQNRMLPAETVDIAPTLAAVIGVTPPADVDGRCLPLADFGKGECPVK